MAFNWGLWHPQYGPQKTRSFFKRLDYRQFAATQIQPPYANGGLPAPLRAEGGAAERPAPQSWASGKMEDEGRDPEANEPAERH